LIKVVYGFDRVGFAIGPKGITQGQGRRAWYGEYYALAMAHKRNAINVYV
jgi:hypothetical protein